MKTRYIKTIIILIALTGFISLAYGGDKLQVLWGKQRAGWGAKNAEFDGNQLVLKKAATIKKIEGTAKRYSIWTGGRAVLTGTDKKSLVGKTLKPGTYVVRPGLDDRQKESTVKIILQ